jgi:hypothetical protein
MEYKELKIEEIKIGLKLKATPKLIAMHTKFDFPRISAKTILIITQVDIPDMFYVKFTNGKGNPDTCHINVKDQLDLVCHYIGLSKDQKKSIDKLLEGFIK